MSLHWWKQLRGGDDWGVRQCRFCKKRELAMYDAGTASIVWVEINDNA